MVKDIEIGTYMEKLKKIIPYWIKHNSEHVGEHQKWMKDAQNLGLSEIAEELESVATLLKKANEHIDSINKKISN